ncbi:MAG: hypothetical protein FWD57_02180 [Polyangiaceae bacterium]|nr:hypothetical protein [Polyangiaceae bacterium]
MGSVDEVIALRCWVWRWVLVAVFPVVVLYGTAVSTGGRHAVSRVNTRGHDTCMP